MKVSFTVLGEPQGKGRPRFTRVGDYVKTYTPDKTAAYENLVKIEYERQCGGKRFQDEQMLDMRIFAYYGIPKSTSKKRRAMMLKGQIRPTKKPDMDNVVKAVADSLNNVAYKDDTQIVDSMVRKFYSDTPRVKVVIQPVKPISEEDKQMMAQREAERRQEFIDLYGIDFLRELVQSYEEQEGRKIERMIQE